MQGFRFAKPLLALLAVAAAFTLTFVWPKQNGLPLDIDGSPRAQAARDRDPYDLTRLAVLNRAILEVKNHYVDPDRVDPKKMLLAGLNAIQSSVAPVIIRYEDGASELTVQVNDQEQSFSVSDVNSPWSLAGRFREIFAFLQQNLDGEPDLDLRDVEYAAVNGMLRTLDPHTVLLTPDVFEEMQMSTRGEFGGLGIVISIRDGALTVIRPMPDTPAARAGLLRMDRIVKINDESTMNMPLSEAVDRLRGPPGSRVNVWVTRAQGHGRTQPRRFELVRAVIHIESVEHRMLGDNVGYIKINSFQGNTSEDMQRALADLHRQELRGLVLDLRDNPGGLLDQAVRVADTFLPSGTVVATQSNDPRERDEKFAHREGTEPDYPMVVLLNGGSASASEIVAGALKNHDRALIVGQRSFGKGSVQVIYNFQDGSALKLTIAQYLTPGDISIQGVGIVPDIEVDPMTVDREDMALTVDDEAMLREADLRSHLTHARARAGQRPSVVLRYYLSEADRQHLQEADPRDQENATEDEFLTRFSQSLLARASRSGRTEMIEDAAPVVTESQRSEMAKAVAQLQRLGVDWAAGTDEGASPVNVTLSTSPTDATAGGPLELRVRVENTGEHTLYQLRATTKSDYNLFNDRELVFGRLAPGESREWSTTLGLCATVDGERSCRLPRSVVDRADGIRVEFSEAHGHAPANAEVRTTLRGLPRPLFAYAMQVADDIQGDGDGVLERGEKASLYLRVRNVGPGRTFRTQANLRNLSGRGILLHDGRFRIDDLEPGQERLLHFTFDVLSDFEDDVAKLEVSVADLDLREAVTEKLELAIRDSDTPVRARTGRVSLAEGATLRAAPRTAAEVLGTVRGVVQLAAQAESGDFVRVALPDGPPAWVASDELVSSGRGGEIQFALGHRPPELSVGDGHLLVTRDASVELSGTAVDDRFVRDVYVFAGTRKVFYQSNAHASDRRRAQFSTRVPLHAGLNYLYVVARESPEVVSRRLLVVRRDGPDGQLLETPRYDEDPFAVGPH
ncbi:MAG: peptidase S41 [Deltaproteobacteria bacterium]|nr:peptidase S41 [Deltaproteobacteria bacterium]